MKYLLNKGFFLLYLVFFVEDQKFRFLLGIKIGGVYKVSFVGRSDDKMIYKLVDFGILVFCLFDFMDGKKSNIFDDKNC